MAGLDPAIPIHGVPARPVNWHARHKAGHDVDRLLSINCYIVRFGAVCSNSCNCCFQNFAMPVVPWPRVSSLAGIR